MKILVVGKKQQMHWPENVAEALSKDNLVKLFLYNKWHGMSSSIVGHKHNAKCLAKQIKKFHPDVVFYVSFDFIPLPYYQILDRFPNVRRIGWAADNFGVKTTRPNFLDLCFVFDTYCLETLKGFTCRGFYMPLCADENTFNYAEYGAKAKPVFIGAANPERIETLAALKTPVVVYGNGWPVRQLKQHEVHNKKVSHKQENILYHKYLPFNMTYSKNVKNGLNFRIFEIGMTGNVIISNDSKDLKKCYTKDEVVSYQTPAELDRILKDVIAHPKKYQEVAMRGYKRTISEHTFERRLKQMFDIVKWELDLQ